jgi:4-amino-4-deoxy-L-arabinose transferase-like glycosyltransferase
VAIVLVATTLGIGVTSDATVYLDAARHLARGDGFVATESCTGGTAPITHWPPLYPWVLSLGVRLGLEPLGAARALAALLLGANSALVAAIVLRSTRRWTAAAIAGGLTATSLCMLEVHTAAWSEPLALFLGLGGLTLTVHALERPDFRTVVLAAVVLGFATLTRYLGGSLVVAAALLHLVLSPAPPSRRFLFAAATSVVGAVPLATFMIRNLLLAGAPTDREIAFQTLGFEHARSILLVLGSWLVPGADRLAALAPLAPVMVGLGGLFALALALLRGDQTCAVHRLFMVVYLVLFLVSVSFFDHDSPLDQRMLAPLFLSSLIVVTIGVSRLAASRWRMAFVFFVTAAYVAACVAAVSHLQERGRGYLGREWHYEQTFATLASLPPDTNIQSNYPDAIHLLTGRAACPISESIPASGVIVYFQDARRFSPRTVGGFTETGPGLEEARRRARAGGLVRETRERNAVLFSR